MGDGMTNAEISTKVLLSESTVRQETIRIYRALAVPGRQEAVAKARALGLIQKLNFSANV
jgi:ATP/maltotriose-dependent transcriptional regulator MalT